MIHFSLLINKIDIVGRLAPFALETGPLHEWDQMCRHIDQLYRVIASQLHPFGCLADRTHAACGVGWLLALKDQMRTV